MPLVSLRQVPTAPQRTPAVRTLQQSLTTPTPPWSTRLSLKLARRNLVSIAPPHTPFWSCATRGQNAHPQCTTLAGWKAVNVELTEAGTRYFSCSVGSAQNTLSECGTSATCTAADGADQATCDTALAADADGTACTAEATCTYVQGTPACETQPWAHCSVLNQKVTVNVSPAPDPTEPDKTAASGAATVAASVATAVVVAALLY